MKKYEPYFLSVLGIVACAWFASAVLFELVGGDVMASRPWSMIEYFQYRDLKAYWIAVAAGIAPPLVIGLLMVMPKPEKIHGDAKWATESDVVKGRMRSKNGILLGRFKGKYLQTEEPAHFLVCAPTRSGKGIGIIIPNLLNFDGSAIIHDIKLENWHFTSGFRAAHGHKVFLWSPLNPDATTHSYNPLDMIREDVIFRLSDAQALAGYLIPLPQKDPIWDQLARFFLTALVIYTLDRKRVEDTPATIGEIYRTLNNQGDMHEWALEASQKPWLDPEARRLFISFAGMTEKERSFVKTSIAKSLNLWANPMIDAATSKSDFNLRDIRKKRMSIYVGVTEDTKEIVAPLVALFFQQAIGTLVQREPGKDEPHKVLFLMDEFASLGRMQTVAGSVTMLASYGGRLMFILQALSTLDEHYGKEGREIIIQNCAYQVLFAASDETTTRYVVGRLGKKTVKSRSQSRNQSSVSRSTSEVGRDLLLPQEFQQLDREKQVVLVEAARPVLADKIKYFEDPVLKPRVMKPAPVPKIEVTGGIQPLVVANDEKPATPSQAALDMKDGKTPAKLREAAVSQANAAFLGTPVPASTASAPNTPAKPADASEKPADNPETLPDTVAASDTPTAPVAPVVKVADTPASEEDDTVVPAPEDAAQIDMDAARLAEEARSEEDELKEEAEEPKGAVDDGVDDLDALTVKATAPAADETEGGDKASMTPVDTTKRTEMTGSDDIAPSRETADDDGAERRPKVGDFSIFDMDETTRSNLQNLVQVDIVGAAVEQARIRDYLNGEPERS